MLNNTTQPQLYGNVTHYGRDLEGTTHSLGCVCMRTCVCLYVQAWESVVTCMCLSVWSYETGVRHYADILQRLAFTNTRLYTPHQCYKLLRCFTHHCLLHMKSFSMSLCLLLSLCCVFQCPCMHQCQPPSLLASDL